MINLNQITTEVQPTAFAEKQPTTPQVSFEGLLKQLQQTLSLDNEMNYTLEQGVFTERNKNNHVTKIIQDIIVMALEQDDTTIQTPSEVLIHKQNKKFIKESLIFLLGNIKQYRLDDRKLKIFLAGKLLQSIYESKS
jgi:hypothetical protein